MIPIKENRNYKSKYKLEKIHPRQQFYYCDKMGTYYANLNTTDKLYEIDNNEKGSTRFHVTVATDFNIYNDSLVIGDIAFLSPLSEQATTVYDIREKTNQKDKSMNRTKFYFENADNSIKGWMYFNDSGEIIKFGVSYNSDYKAYNLVQDFTRNGAIMAPTKLYLDFEVRHQDFAIQGSTKIQYSNFEIGAFIPEEVYASLGYELSNTDFDKKRSTVKRKHRKRQELYANNNK